MLIKSHCALALMLFGWNVPAHATEPLRIPRLTGPVVADGKLQEPAWRNAARVSDTDFTRWIADQSTIDPSEFVLRLFHDGKYLHVALASYDGYVIPDRLPENADGLYSFSAIAGNGTLRHYRLRWSSNPPQAGGQMAEGVKWGAHLRGPFADTTRGGGGYILEFSIPLIELAWKPGQSARINVIVQDRDGTPGTAYNERGSEFVRYAWGSLDNEDRTRYREIRLAP